MQQIADWLKKLGMPEYTKKFAEERIDIDVLRELTDQDLDRLGIPLGHRRRMLEGDPRSRQRFDCRYGTLRRPWQLSQLGATTPSAASSLSCSRTLSARLRSPQRDRTIDVSFASSASPIDNSITRRHAVMTFDPRSANQRPGYKAMESQ